MPPTLDRALPTGRARGGRRRAPVLAPLPPPVLPSPAPEVDEAVIPLADAAAESPFSPTARARRRGRDASLLLDSNASDTAAAFDPDPVATATATASETTHGVPTSSAPTQPPVATVTSSSTAPIHTSTTTITISGRRVSRKRKMDYAEIIEPLEKADHRSDEERAMAPAPASVKAKRAKKLLSAKFIKIDKLERTDSSKHEKTDKSEKSEKLVLKQEKKKRVKESSRDRSPAVINPSPHPTNISSPVHKAVTTVESGVRTTSTESAVDTSSIDRVVTTRVSSGRATPAENASRGESSETSVRSKELDSVSRTRNVDVSCIKDCYVILNHIDVTQYLKKSRPGEEPENEPTEEAGNVDTEASQDYWDVETIQPCIIAATVPPASPPQPPPPTPRDPTQEIESQLALLEEMSNHLTATRESNGDETSRVGAVAASPACDEESTASVDVPSDAAAAPVPLPPPPSVSYSTSASKRPRLEEPSPRLAPSTPASSCGGQTPEDFDKDSVSSSDIGTQDGGDSPNKQTTKRKPRKRKHRADAVEHITFEAHRGPVLDVKTVGRHVLAACEDGSVYCYSLKSGKLKRQYCGHSAAVICLSILVREGPGGEDPVPEFLFTGSLDHHLRCFQFKTGTLVNQPVNLGKPIQCMDENWGTIFIGTKMGEVAKFYTKSFKLNEEYIRCSKDSILAIKATKEGARKVVIVAARNEPVTIRDANSGLLMRVVGHNLPHTVYSLLLEQSLLYCGTKTGKIPVFSFTSGEEVGRYSAGYGVVCMRVYNQLLFAGCYDGNIYIYSTQDKSLISCIPGPGKMLLCLDVVKNRIIAGSKDNKLQAWPLPTVVKNCIRESRHR